ncbi:MAG: hydrogenase maturation nickel metallochaperone HypA [Myxococcaceae bacterium]|nr:hydrogenase maturation nickel metallochaperone HypA [Myxococcaceae bacterium]
MHEVALAQRIVEIVQEQAGRLRFEGVKRVFLRLGAFAHVEPEALTFGFAAAARGTIAQGATLEIERAPGTGFCAGCGGDVVVTSRFSDCPVCGFAPLRIAGGDEFRVTELEVA